VHRSSARRRACTTGAQTCSTTLSCMPHPFIQAALYKHPMSLGIPKKLQSFIHRRPLCACVKHGTAQNARASTRSLFTSLRHCNVRLLPRTRSKFCWPSALQHKHVFGEPLVGNELLVCRVDMHNAGVLHPRIGYVEAPETQGVTVLNDAEDLHSLQTLALWWPKGPWLRRLILLD
jgi:hypothetical protein